MNKKLHRVMMLHHDEIQKIKLSRVEYPVLMFVKDKGAVVSADVARWELFDRSRALCILTSLSEKGYLEKVRLPGVKPGSSRWKYVYAL